MKPIKKGDRVMTTAKHHLLKNKGPRYGVVVGGCVKSRDFVRVCWEGWKPTSSVAVSKDVLEVVESV